MPNPTSAPEKNGRPIAAHVQTAVAQAQMAPQKGRPAAHVQAAFQQVRNATGTSAPAAQARLRVPVSTRVAQKMEVSNNTNNNHNNSNVNNNSMQSYVIRKGTLLYHSTDIKDEVIKELQNGTSALHTPAYFKTYPSNLYGKKILIFEATAQINLVDLTRLETVKLLYQTMVQGGADAVAQALAYKSGATIQGQEIVALSGWKTASEADIALANWIGSKGEAGWRIPFRTDDEIMLTTVKDLACKGKHKW